MKSEQEWEKELHDVLEKLRNNSISEIGLIKCHLDPNGIRVLAKALKVNHSLTIMDLSGNDIGDEGAKVLAQVLKENHSLTTMFLSSDKIGIEGAKALAEALKENHWLTTISLSVNGIGIEGVVAFAGALKQNHSLKTLNLDFNSIDAEGVRVLASGLKENQSLTMLNLSYNRIRTEGIVAIGEALKQNCSLKTLDLGYNKIGAEGAEVLANLLKENHSLTTLNLNSNDIGTKGAIALASGLEKNQFLTTLNLKDNDIDVKGAMAFANMLKENHSLITLNLKHNNIGSEGVTALGEALKENYSLIRMRMQYNNINSEIPNITLLEKQLWDCLLRNRIHRAVQVSDLEKVKECIQQGAELLLVTGSEANTPLHWAIAKGHVDVIKLLLAKMVEQKLNLSVKNKNNQTPLGLAQENDQKEIIQLLQEAIAKQKAILAQENNRKGFTQLLQRIMAQQETTHPKHHIQRGEKFLINEEYSEALQCFEEALKLQPEHAEALLRKGTTLLKLTRPEETQQEKLTRLEKAKQVFEKVVVVEGKSTEKYQQLAKKYLQKIEKKQALLQQQSVITPLIETTNINALIPNNTEREGLLERASSKTLFYKSKIQPRLKQTTKNNSKEDELSEIAEEKISTLVLK